MRNTYFKLWVHAILKVSDEIRNQVLIRPSLEPLLYLKLEKDLTEQGCEVLSIGGRSDHVHILYQENPLRSIHETLLFTRHMTMKWYQEHDFKTSYAKFDWLNSYCAYSVSESLLDKTIYLIENQAIIHKQMGCDEEIWHLNMIHNADMRTYEFEGFGEVINLLK